MKPERFWNLVRMRLRSVLRRNQVERELEKELRFHVDQEIEANLGAGMASTEARHAALRRRGGRGADQRGVPRYAPNKLR
jgi:hypothetical protein